MLIRDKDPSLRFGMTMKAVAGMTVITNAGTTVEKVLQVS